MLSPSLSPLSVVSWGSHPVYVSRLGWDAASRSILLWVRGSAVPLVCRTRGASAGSIAGLVAVLRSARSSGNAVVLGVREGWSPDRWFCAARTLVDHASLRVPGVDKPLMLTGDQQYELCPTKHTCDGESCVC